MIVKHRWGGIALLAALSGVATAPLVHAADAPPIRQVVAVQTAPEHAMPDAVNGDEGLEAREAMGVSTAPPSSDAPQSGTLDAQYAAIRSAGAATPPPAALVAVADKPALGADQGVTPSDGRSVALARRVVESAQAFSDYMHRAAALRPDYADAAGVSRALSAGGTYEFSQIQEGAVAYVALAALQAPRFVQAVVRLRRQGGEAAADALAADPRQALAIPGATQAAMHAAAALARFGLDLQGAGAAVKQSAYSIQRQAWSKAAVNAPEEMLVELKAHSAERETLGTDGGRTLLVSLTGLRGAQAEGTGRLTPTVARGLTLAALAVFGRADEEHAGQVATLLTEASSAQCLKMARLNLYQCLSVAGPEYEDVFCLGQHAMLETARCVADASGWTPAAVGTGVAAAPQVLASIMVPVASASDPASDQAPALGPSMPPPPSGDVAVQMASAELR